MKKNELLVRDDSVISSKNEVLQDYCQRCGAELGSPKCCKNITTEEHEEYLDSFGEDVPAKVSDGFYTGVDRYGNAGVFEDFEQSIGE